MYITSKEYSKEAKLIAVNRLPKVTQTSLFLCLGRALEIVLWFTKPGKKAPKYPAQGQV